MSFFTALYNLLIGPLELFFEILFSMVNQVINNPGLSIIFLSLAMNFLVLPLYKMSDAMQEEEAATEARLKPTVTHIKKTFKGDERFMILQMYYRENHYKPSDALKGSVSLLLEIPFFMAAYNFLSSLQILHGASLGPISDLASPDAMLVIGGITINVLPILMTAINLISSAIYTKGASTRSKVQLYVMAGLFLVLLYDSPSGLVFYWTLNNLFSLVKNIFMKLKNPKKVLCGLCSAVGLAALIFVAVTHPMPTARSQFLLCCLTLVLQLPMVTCFIAKRQHCEKKLEPAKVDSKTFWIAALFLTVMTGLFIPSGVISASPEEFLNPITHTSPLVYILNATLTAAGFFLIWFGMFYLLAKDSGKKWMGYGISALCFVAVADFMFFGKNYGTLSPNLVFNTLPVYSHKALNLLIVFVIFGLVYLICAKKQEILRFSILIATLAALVISTVSMVQIQQVVADKSAHMQQDSSDLPVIPLSKSGKNVVVLMLDRGISSYVPFLMNEKPELKEQFAGFTYYPNTVSFGSHTNFGAPALFGGYEYTPEEMNKRNSELLKEKHNEALKVMPVLFSRNGFETTVCDPPYAGYEWIPDLSIYQDYPDIHAYNSMQSVYSDDARALQEQITVEKSNRNFFCYSVFKISPVLMQRYIYNSGKYNDMGLSSTQYTDGLFYATGNNVHFLHAYSVLQELADLTDIRDSSQNTFLMLTNDTTHEPTLLQEPSYTPADTVDNSNLSLPYPGQYTLDGQVLNMHSVYQVRHYHVNMAAFLQLGNWFDYLRAQGVFDNTRIILVSDHGYETYQREDMLLSPSDDLMFYNPLLMVKDFDAQQYRIDTTFMTNADTPVLACDGIINAPHNPFTGNPITNSAKLESPMHICFSHQFDIRENNGTTYLPGPWYSVHDNIFDLNNWEYLGEK